MLLAGRAVFAQQGAAKKGSAAESQEEKTPRLTEELEPLHREAKSARAKKQYAKVEEIRLQRRRMIEESKDGASPWKKGADAIAKAREAVAGMRYADACRILEAAWAPFASAPERKAVFGDLALEWFLANEAGRTIDSGNSVVLVEKLREALQRASVDDPCQVEIEAALAFLTPPKAEEAFQRQDSRPSIKLRNARLLAIGRNFAAGGPIMPWHAPVEYLKAESSGFVLRDLEYLRTFFDPGAPEARLTGADRFGKTWSLVLGGGVLGTSMESESAPGARRQVLKLHSYDRSSDQGSRAWRELVPQTVVVASIGTETKVYEWQLTPAAVAARLQALQAAFESALDTSIKQQDDRLSRIAERFPPLVIDAVGQIRDGRWRNGPPPGSPIEAVLRQAAIEFETYANNLANARKPVEADAARRAQQEIESLVEIPLPYREIVALIAELQKPADPAPGGEGQATVMAQWEQARQLVERIELRLPEPDVPTDSKPDAKPDTKPDTEPDTEPEFGGAENKSAEHATPGGGSKGDRLEALDHAELLAECRAYQIHPDGLTLVKQIVDDVDRSVGAEGDSSSEQRAVRLRLKQSHERLGELLGKVRVDGTEPLRLDDFAAMRDHLLEVRSACSSLERPEYERLSERADRWRSVYDRIVKPIEDTNRLLQVTTRGQSPERTWRLGEVEWKFFEWAGLTPPLAASLIDAFPPIVVAESDLERVSKEIAAGVAIPALPPLRAGSAAAPGPLVDDSGPIAVLRIGMPLPPRRLGAIVLVERDGNREDDGAPVAAAGPDFFSGPKQGAVEHQGNDEKWLLMDDAGLPRRLLFDADAGELVVEYPGVKGHIPIGIAADLGSHARFIEDSLSRRISVAAVDKSQQLFDVERKGTAIEGGYHSIAELIDLDRNIINEFMPPALLYSPSLPAWRAYRGPLSRWAPDYRLRWAVPRPAYRTGE